MANNSFTVTVVGEIRKKAGDPVTANVNNAALAASENRQISTLNGAFKIQPATAAQTGVTGVLSQVVFDSPVVDCDGNVVYGWLSTATVAALLALWNA